MALFLSVRILSGKNKNRLFQHTQRSDLRPTLEHVRATAFDILIHRFFPKMVGSGPGAHLSGQCVLDLFCGTGAYAFEALSRGAEKAFFIDKEPPTDILHTANLLGFSQKITYIKTMLPALSFYPPTDLVFMDPPYAFPRDILVKIMEKLSQVVPVHAIVVLETPEDQVEQNHFLCLLSKKTRGPWLHFFSLRI